MKFTEVNINDLERDEKERLFKLSILEVYSLSLNNIKEITGYITLTLGMLIITSEYFNSDSNNSKETKLTEEALITLNNLHDIFFAESEMFFKNSIERCYISYYQAYEVYVSNLMKIVFWFFPEFFNDKSNIDIKDIFNSDSILTVRNKLIDQKVKDTIQTNNISQLIKKFKDLFGVEIKIAKENLDYLIVASNTRNLLIHNNGIVNNIYIQNLNSSRISSSYHNGDKVIISEKDLRDCNKFFNKIVEETNSSMVSQMEQIIKYSNSKL
ncbi:hypothetical protein IM700_010085 [Paenibacillus sp. DXFW5]|uniref:Cthe-2314-like HEPN domain-containing protein n=1 Tax=Paenibacillus rhizolycopersici TaxID=2780073 RepID=A0ABS2H8C1_9BACL|nr:hypothetical protein [Paenibacillus rhizolycopersici]MBM6995994.1 hypothetical protein [Paenibacillus rhizolycopersici]